MTDVRRDIPGTDTVLSVPGVAKAERTLGRELVRTTIAAVQQRARTGEIRPADVVEETLAALPETASSLRSVLNASGIIVHTNLGRAPLSAAALDAVAEAGGATDVEFDLDSGARSRRGRGVTDALLGAVPEAEAAHVVNNNAAALSLCSLALASGPEIVVSKGELVEIGDGFRLPELLRAAGATLREVGTTNRTSYADYAEAIGPDTGFVLKVHPSNFRMSGFTSTVGIARLASLEVPVVADIGSGLLSPHPYLPDEPDAATALRDGAAVVTASGDKLLGGPQSGLLLGRAELIERLSGHPVARAMRVDKLTLAALEATLRGPAPPVRQALDADPAALRGRSEWVAGVLERSGIDAVVTDCVAAVGGGGAPGTELSSVGVSIPSGYARPLRGGDPPVVGRIERGRCVLDLRTVDPDDDQRLAEVVRRCTC